MRYVFFQDIAEIASQETQNEKHLIKTYILYKYLVVGFRVTKNESTLSLT